VELQPARISAESLSMDLPRRWEATAPTYLGMEGLAGGQAGELQVEIADRWPIFADETPPTERPFGFRCRARLWEVIDYARGSPPSQHSILREMDPERVWRTTWRPWEAGSATGQQQVSKPVLPDQLSRWSLTSQACLHVSPPSALMRTTSQPDPKSQWLLWQIEGVQQVVLIPPNASCMAQSAKCESSIPLSRGQTRYDPWLDDNAELYSCTVSAGEALSVPPGWWVSVLSLRPSIAIACLLDGGASVQEEPLEDDESIRRAALDLLRRASTQEFVKSVLKPGAISSELKSPRCVAVCHVAFRRGPQAQLTRSSRNDGPQALFLGVDPALGTVEQIVRSMSVGERALTVFMAPGQGPVVVDIELFAVKVPPPRDRVSEFEMYSKAWWSWFEEPRLWEALPGCSVGSAATAVCSRCLACSGTLRCSRCGRARYCSRQCQAEDWRKHCLTCAAQVVS